MGQEPAESWPAFSCDPANFSENSHTSQHVIRHESPRGTAAHHQKCHAECHTFWSSGRHSCSRHSRRQPNIAVGPERSGPPSVETAAASQNCCATCCSRPPKPAGLGRETRHQFRHIDSSLLNDLKVPVRITQEQLGHASVSTTLNIYTQVADASHRKAVEAVEERFFGETDCCGLLTSSMTADQPQSTSGAVH